MGKEKVKDIKYFLCGRKGHSVDQCWWAQKTSSSGAGSDQQRQVYNISAQPGDHSISIMPSDQLRGFQDLRPLHQQQPLNQPYFSQPSSSSAVSSVFASGHGQGFSGHQLRVNHFTSSISEDCIMEVNFNNPIYDIGPSLPQECQEPWAALIDTGAVASIAPQPFVPHIPIKEKSETLTSVNGGNLGIKHVTFITDKVIMHCQLPHCGRCQKSNHWSRCNSSQSSSSSSSWKREVHSSATSAQSTSSLSSKSLLCIRFGSSRSCSKSSCPLVRSSVHNLRQAINIQHHCRDR